MRRLWRLLFADAESVIFQTKQVELSELQSKHSAAVAAIVREYDTRAADNALKVGALVSF
jgi:hypothetical protein